jgi:hypothetical protein
MSSFLRLRQDSLFLPRRLLLLHHDIFDFTALPSFVVPRYFRFHRDAISLLHHNTFFFARTPFAQILLTPLLSRAPRSFAKPARSFSRRLQHGVRKDSLNLPRFYTRIEIQLLFLPDFAFCSLTFWILHRLSESSTAPYFCSQHTYQIRARFFILSNYFEFLKWG